jgi:hypothetical protein
MINRIVSALTAVSVCALLLVLVCSVGYASPTSHLFTNNTWYANVESNATYVTDHYHYQYVFTLWRIGGSSSMNMSTFSVGNAPVYNYTGATNTKGANYFGNPVWASTQTSVRWDKPSGGTSTLFVSSSSMPSTPTVTFSFDSVYEPELVAFFAQGGSGFTSLGSGYQVWGMSSHAPEPTSLCALALGVVGFGAARLRRRRSPKA